MVQRPWAPEEPCLRHGEGGDTTATQFGYDVRGRRTSVTDQNNKTTAYGYDDADRLITVTDAATNVTTYGYDSESAFDNLIWPTFDTFIWPTLRPFFSSSSGGFRSVAPEGAESCGPVFRTAFRTERTTGPRKRVAECPLTKFFSFAFLPPCAGSDTIPCQFR